MNAGKLNRVLGFKIATGEAIPRATVCLLAM